jgi:hypothetical protein
MKEAVCRWQELLGPLFGNKSGRQKNGITQELLVDDRGGEAVEPVAEGWPSNEKMTKKLPQS